MLRTPPPTFTSNDRPASVVDTFGQWLSGELDGFRWVKSRRTLCRTVATQRHELHLQPSTYSRAGAETWVTPRVSVFDDRLKVWRQANPSASAVLGAEAAAPCVYSSMLVNLERALGSVQLSGKRPAVEFAAAEPYQFIDYVADVVLTAFGAFASPARLVSALPPSWCSMIGAGTIEWAIACGDPAAGAELIKRALRQPLIGRQNWAMRTHQFCDGWGRAEQGQPPAQPPNGYPGLGWLARTHSLIALDDVDRLNPTTRKWWRGVRDRH